MNIALLHRLRDAAGAFVPLEALGGDRAAVVRDLDALAGFGYGLERHPTRGVAYRGPAGRLCPDQIEWELGTATIGRRVAVWSRLPSTNDLALRASASRSNEGLVVLAEEQTAGRGRRGRPWTAPPGAGLLMSALVFPPACLGEVGPLTALGAVAAAEVVESATGRPARIKWPNDVRVEGRKLAGVLVERRRGAVIGIGLNVGHGPDDFPPELRGSATSLRLLTGTAHDRSELARALIRALDGRYREAVGRGPSALDDAWRSRLEPLGRPVRLATRAGAVEGRLVGADLRTGLVVEAADGRLRTVPHAAVLAFEDEEAGARFDSPGPGA